MSNVKIPRSKIFDSQILVHSCTQNNYVSLAKEFQKHLYTEHRKNGVIDQGKYTKRASKRKLADIKYPVQDNSDVAQNHLSLEQ